MEVLQPNALIDEVVPLDSEALLLLQTRTFDVVINPDASIVSSRLAAIARASDKRGFGLDVSGDVVPLNDCALLWYELGQNDLLKRSNTQTYQSILLGISNLPAVEHPIIWEITDEEAEFARRFASRCDFDPGSGLTIGLNTGAGGRWRWKKWTEGGFKDLIEAIAREMPDARILLYGGPEERERNSELAGMLPGRLFDTGTGNTLRQFGALVSLADIVVTGDTMAMHLATALQKRVIALFGPTSDSEIELYGRGTKIAPRSMPCIGCYLSDCDIRPACMERISAAEVMAAIRVHAAALQPDEPLGADAEPCKK